MKPIVKKINNVNKIAPIVKSIITPPL